MDSNSFLSKGRLGSEYWINSESKTFEELCNENILLPPKWKSSMELLGTEYSSKILKPANNYAKIFSCKPEMIEEGTNLVLRYKTHAEIWFEEKKDGLYALDKTMQRQFYPSETVQDIKKDNFNAFYKFYTTWILDIDKTFLIREVDSSPFSIYNSHISFKKVDNEKQIWDIGFIHFSIKNKGEHIRNFNDSVFGIINVQTPICDIIIEDKKIADWIISEQ
jgi:hypothetical protein